MNNTRRKEIRSITNEIKNLKDRVENILEDENNYRYNMPVNLQGSKRYSDSRDSSFLLEQSLLDLEECIYDLQGSIDE